MENNSRSNVPQLGGGHTVSLEEGLAKMDEMELDVKAWKEHWNMTSPEEKFLSSADGEIFEGGMPNGINTWSTDDLGDYYAIYTEYVSYLEMQVSTMKSNLDNWKHRIEFITASLRKEYRHDSGGTDRIIGDNILTDSRYLYEMHGLLRAKACALAMENFYKAHNKINTGISRLITLRQEKSSRQPYLNRGQI